MIETHTERDLDGRPLLFLLQPPDGPYGHPVAVTVRPEEAQALARQLDAFAREHAPRRDRPRATGLRLVVDNRTPAAS